ncbi:vesicle-associated protein 1-2-like isoform X2 [Benincasa hispida]|uniref:vesicle-associated protein 1-2-like isoform X2 n=1 Tax=Benincasa hispida TaxID=102211 RepID=UPI0019001A8A|nr:vesicle-associated protein 1-2-like isoform X2 [Benincasa hispida]
MGYPLFCHIALIISLPLSLCLSKFYIMALNVVRMQAQTLAPPDMLCKDKFLIQSTVVPADTTDVDITSTLFAKEGGKYIEEQKLGVTLVSPSISPVVSPVDEALKEEEVALAVTEPNNLCKAVEEIVDQEPLNKNHVPGNATEPRDVNEEEPEPSCLPNDFIDGNEENLEMIKHLEELKLKLSELELKLCQAQNAISKLKEEKQISIQETKFLKENFSELRKTELNKVQVGFPVLYLYMVAIVCTFLGRLLR